MSSTNPFAPPLAHVSDIHTAAEDYQPVRIFSTSGRIGRVRLLAYGVASYLVFAIFTMALAVPLGGFAVVVGLLVYLVVNLMFMIQRSHDMDLSGWFSILAFIPFVGLFWLFKSGSAGSNNWGAPPPPNTLGVKILAWVLPAIMVVGILAAVALPAYSDYAKRAKSAQMK